MIKLAADRPFNVDPRLVRESAMSISRRGPSGDAAASRTQLVTTWLSKREMWQGLGHLQRRLSSQRLLSIISLATRRSEPFVGRILKALAAAALQAPPRRRPALR